MKNKITNLTEEKLHDIITKSVKKIIIESYQLDSLDELMEFMWVKPKFTNLNVDIFVDDGGSYLRHNHELLLFVRNGYNNTVNEFIPFSVSSNPIILDETIDYNISYDDIFNVQDFIVTNLEILIALANREIKQTMFIHSIKVPSYVLSENTNLLIEMSTLRKEDTNLPMDIWVDECATFQGHAPRLKFRASREQRTTREYSSMLLTNPPSIENFPKNTPLKKKDIEKLELFVIRNLELLLQLANGEIDFNTEFLPNLKI